MEKRKPKEVTKEDFKLMELASKHKCPFAHKLLVDKGFIPSPLLNKQLGFGEVDPGGG